MKVIKPLAMTDAVLVSSTVPETDYAAWSSTTTYAIGDRCIRTGTHRIYESLVASNINNIPENNLTGVTPKWLDIGPTNRWAMFDNVVGTITSVVSPFVVVLNPGPISGIALMEMTGKELSISMKNATGGTVVYSRVISLDGTIITSFYDWFFQPYEQRSDIVLTDLPFHYFAPELTITIISTSGSVGCGVCKIGETITIGDTQYGATAGIIDYSRKDVDTFGNYIIVKRSFAKRNSFKAETATVDFNRIFRTLAALRATACIWIGSEDEHYEPLIVFGFFKDFSIDVAYAAMNYCSLEIEGLI